MFAEIAFGLESIGVDPTEIAGRVAEAADFLGIGRLASRKISELSGGEKQRVAAARAMMMSPKVILADEPSGSLDEANKRDLHRLLCHLREQYRQTIIIVTHDKELAGIADRILEIRDGVIES